MRAYLHPLAIPCLHLPNQSAETIQSGIELVQDDINVNVMSSAEVSDTASATNSTEVLTSGRPLSLEEAALCSLPSINWFVKLSSLNLCFFEVELGSNDKPYICRSVSFVDKIANPIVYVRDVLMNVNKHFTNSPTVEDVASFLKCVSCMEPRVAVSLSCVADTLNSIIERYSHEESDVLHVDSNESQDHRYSQSLKANCLDDNTNDDHSVQLETLITSLKFLSHQLHLLMIEHAKRRRYDPALIRWCLLVHFHSPAAYKAMLQSKCLVLPSERLLSSYTHPLSISPGVTNEREHYFKEVSSAMSELQKNVAVIIDEMYIKPEISYSAGSVHGFADNCNTAVAATTMLTVMTQSLCGSFRDVVAFIPVKQLTGDDETRYLKDAILLLESAGLKVCCVICDNSRVNRMMMSNFGAVTDDVSVMADPPHPVDPKRKLIFIVDPCHLLKCIRNNWINKRIFKVDGRDVSFEYIMRLYKEDQKRTVKLAPNLTVKVVSPTNVERQSVRLAASLFSPPVIAALESYIASDPVQFDGATAVVEFLQQINKFWCWANIQNVHQGKRSRDPHQQPFRKPDDWRIAEFDKLQAWLISWNGDSSCSLTKETYSAFQLTLTAMKQLIIYLLTDIKADFVLSGRFQQDPLEERFAAHRQRAGCSYNPSALQFQQTEKKLSVFKFVANNMNSNTARIESRSVRQHWNNEPLTRQAQKKKV